VTWAATFTLMSSEGLSDLEIAESDRLRKATSAIVQIDPHRVKLMLWQDCHAEAAVGRSLEAVWTALEEVQTDAWIESLTLDGDVDCTPQLRHLESLRSSLLGAAAVR
jgi:hypothetical protein